MVQPISPPNPGRRKFLSFITASMASIGAFFLAIPFLSAFKPSARAEAAGAPVQVDISSLTPGQLKVVEWRGKPIFVVKMEENTVKLLSSNLSRLADPEGENSKQPEYVKNQSPENITRGSHFSLKRFVGKFSCTGPSVVLPFVMAFLNIAISSFSNSGNLP